MTKSTLLRSLLICCAIAATLYWGRQIFDLQTLAVFRDQFNWTGFLPAAFASILASYLVRTLRFVVLLRNKIPIRPHTIAEFFVVLNFLFGFASLTPGQLGDVLKVQFVYNRFAIPRGYLLRIFIYEKALDLACIIAVAAVAIWSEQLITAIAFNVQIAGIVLAAGAIVVTLALLELRRRKIDLGALFDWRALPLVLVLTIVFWVLVIWGWRQVWLAHDIDVSMMATGFAVSGSTLISIASFIPGAIGVSEVSVAGALILQGMEREAAGIASLLTRCYMLAIIANGVLFAPAALWLWVRSRPGRPGHQCDLR